RSLHHLNLFVCNSRYRKGAWHPLCDASCVQVMTMKAIDYLALITRNSLRNRRRSLLTISSLAASLCLLGLLMAAYRALFLGGEATPAQALRLVTHNRVSL